MKIERLLSMIIYLLNHQRVSARVLADRFDVSIRTIQRDVDTLTLAGIPIIAFTGVDGGYEIMEDYKSHVQLSNPSDYQIIVAALSGFQSALSNPKIDHTLEKVQSLATDPPGHFILDFSVLKEKEQQNADMNLAEQAIVKQQVLSFTYTNAQSKTSLKTVEPIAIIYQWYAWYLLAFDLQAQSYRYYKFIRMEDVSICATSFIQRASLEVILQQMKQQDTRSYVTIKAIVKNDFYIKAMEFLNAQVEEELEHGKRLITMRLPMEEELWKGTLLSFGDAITIIEPSEVKVMLAQRCRHFLQQNDDIQMS